MTDLAKQIQELRTHSSDKYYDVIVDSFRKILKDNIADIVTGLYDVDNVKRIAELHQLIDADMLDMTHRQLSDMVFSNGTEEQQIRVHDIMIEAD